VAGQSLNTQLTDIQYDPFVASEQTELGGDLVVHYAATLVDGNDFYIEKKTGSCPARQRVTGAAARPAARTPGIE
jgi:predicted metal-binding protein